MIRSLILLLCCTGWAAAAKGDFVDDCDYPGLKTRCGDTCVDYRKRCICEGEKINTYRGPNHCCVDISPTNSNQCSEYDINSYICPHSKVLNKTETCHGHCYNDYEASEKIGRDSHFHCDDNT